MHLFTNYKYLFSSFIIVACCWQQCCLGQSTTVRPYKFGFTIDQQQHRSESRDERGIVMGEFGFITADGIYHVTVYATDEQGRFRILAMKNYPYESPPKTVEVMVQPKIPPPTTTTTTTTTTKPLTRHNFNTQACSGCFLTNGNNKPNEEKTSKSDIRPLSQPLPSSGTSLAVNSKTNNKIPATGKSTNKIMPSLLHKENDLLNLKANKILNKSYTTASEAVLLKTQKNNTIIYTNLPKNYTYSTLALNKVVAKSPTNTNSGVGKSTYQTKLLVDENTTMTNLQTQKSYNSGLKHNVASQESVTFKNSNTSFLNKYAINPAPYINTHAKNHTLSTHETKNLHKNALKNQDTNSRDNESTTNKQQQKYNLRFSEDSFKYSTPIQDKHQQQQNKIMPFTNTKDLHLFIETPQLLRSPLKRKPFEFLKIELNPVAGNINSISISQDLHQKTTKPATQGSSVTSKTNVANSPPIMDIIMQKVLPALMGKNGASGTASPTQNSTPNSSSKSNVPSKPKSNSEPTTTGNTKKTSGSSAAAGVNGADGDLYRFKYILDYHGHTETGKRNGNKQGTYFAIGDDNVERTIDYVANEFGYQPRIRFRKLDSNEIKSKENSLKDYEFIWFKE